MIKIAPVITILVLQPRIKSSLAIFVSHVLNVRVPGVKTPRKSNKPLGVAERCRVLAETLIETDLQRGASSGSPGRTPKCNLSPADEMTVRICSKLTGLSTYDCNLSHLAGVSRRSMQEDLCSV